MSLAAFKQLLLHAFPQGSVYHYEAYNAKAPYIVWHEYRKNIEYADNKKCGGFWRVQVDCFVKDEFDTCIHTLTSAFETAEIPYKHLVYFERDTKLVHHVFDCEVLLHG